MTDLFTVSPAAFQSPASVVRTITGQSIAKSEWGPRKRAHHAAQWKLGTVKVEPSIKLAAEVFRCSEQLVRKAVAYQQEDAWLDDEMTTPLDPNSWWTGLNSADRDNFVRAHLLSIWDAIERVTSVTR
jgi:hypothetical protein